MLPVRNHLQILTQQFRPNVVYWSHSYLAAWAGKDFRHLPQIVEFANLESRRQRNLAAATTGPRRLLRQVEAAKGVWWEPKVTREASLCVALTEKDAEVLRQWKGKVCLAPNGVETYPYFPSPKSGYVLALASYDYEPNVQAARRVIRDVWPHVKARIPGARLVVAGRRSEALAPEFESVAGVTVTGTLSDVSDVYAGAAVAVATATTGGGSQLKLTEALSRGRSVVMSSFSAAGMPTLLKNSGSYWVADTTTDLLGAIVQALEDLPDRHAREVTAWEECQSLRWDHATEPLVQAIADLACKKRAGQAP